MSRPTSKALTEARPPSEHLVIDLVVLDCTDRAGAVAELAQPLWGFKRGRRTFTWPTAELHRPAG